MPSQPPQILHDFGGDPDAPLLHIAHANGFPPATYAPLAEMLTDTYHVVGLAARPLWPGSRPEEIKTWHDLADDLLHGLEALDAEGIVSLGHSLGGVTTLLAAVQQPALFRAIILLDPVLLPPRWLAFLRWARHLRIPWHPPLVKGALRRRRVWPDSETAYLFFKEKALFSSWQDTAVRAYVGSGLRPTADGQVELAYSPQWEARIFDSVPTDEWKFVPRLNPNLPLLFIRGEHSTTFRSEALARAARLAPHAQCVVASGAGHMFPLERPAQTAALIRTFLEGEEKKEIGIPVLSFNS